MYLILILLSIWIQAYSRPVSIIFGTPFQAKKYSISPKTMIQPDNNSKFTIETLKFEGTSSLDSFIDQKSRDRIQKYLESVDFQSQVEMPPYGEWQKQSWNSKNHWEFKSYHLFSDLYSIEFQAYVDSNMSHVTGCAILAKVNGQKLIVLWKEYWCQKHSCESTYTCVKGITADSNIIIGKKGYRLQLESGKYSDNKPIEFEEKTYYEFDVPASAFNSN